MRAATNSWLSRRAWARGTGTASSGADARSSRGRSACLVLATVALALVCGAVQAQPRYGLSPDADAVFGRWLASTCIVDEERALVEQMRRFAPELASAFRRAIAEGPPAADLAKVRAEAEARYAARAKFPLDEYRIAGVNREDLDRFRRVSGSQFIDDQVRRYVLGYRSNAVAGLGVVGGAEARAILTRIARNRADPLAAAAREALKAMQTPR